MRAERVVLPSVAALVAAMLGRMGWVDWPAVATVGLTVGGVMTILTVGISILVIFPSLLLTWIVEAALSLFPSRLPPSGAAPASEAYAPPCGKNADRMFAE